MTSGTVPARGLSPSLILEMGRELGLLLSGSFGKKEQVFHSFFLSFLLYFLLLKKIYAC